MAEDPLREPIEAGDELLTRIAAGSSIDLERLQGITPGEFERAMTGLLRSLGLQAEQTQLTADGGIDIWAIDNRPILGGRVIVQCKRYATGVSVGEPTVRELYGLVHAHGVNKGIVITTSHFTSGALRFAEGKPLELLDGVQLMSLVASIGTESIGLPVGNDGSRHFGSFDVVLQELEEWRRTYSQPYSLRFSVTSGEFLEELEETVNSKIGACQDMEGRIVDKEGGAVEVLWGIDYLKALYLMVEGAQFRPMTEPQRHCELPEEGRELYWQSVATSVSDEILLGLKHLCEFFEKLAPPEKPRLSIDEHLYLNPRADCALGWCQRNIEKSCVKHWWKPQRSR